MDYKSTHCKPCHNCWNTSVFTHFVTLYPCVMLIKHFGWTRECTLRFWNIDWGKGGFWKVLTCCWDCNLRHMTHLNLFQLKCDQACRAVIKGCNMLHLLWLLMLDFPFHGWNCQSLIKFTYLVKCLLQVWRRWLQVTQNVRHPWLVQLYL